MRPKFYYVDPPLHTTAKKAQIHSDLDVASSLCPARRCYVLQFLFVFLNKFRDRYFIVRQHLTEIYVLSASWISFYFLSYSDNKTPFGKSFWKPTLAKMDTSHASCT